jgi:hypothetical protein
LLLALGLGASGCGDELDYTTDDGLFVQAHYGDWRDEAALRYRTLLDFHTDAIFPSCTPNGGVCHNSKEYPDMHTPGNFLTVIERPCNVSVPDPELVDDVCEPIGDVVQIRQNEGVLFEATIGSIVLEERTEEWDGEEVTITDLVLSLDRAPSFGLDDDGQNYDFRIVRRQDGVERTLVDVERRLFIEINSRTARVVNAISPNPLDEESYRTLTERVSQGDLNQNGTFGGWRARLITPGDPENSYLLWRITGRSPPPMPLANTPLREAAVAALICWIEQLENTTEVSTEMLIDYENCDLSQWAHPLVYTP